jgi:hypothetical protein
VDPTPKHGAVLVPMYFPYTPKPGVKEMFGIDFKIKAHIDDPRVRYRQYIKGRYLYNGVPQTHQLRDGVINQTKFQEDVNEEGSYGDRNIHKFGLSV